MARTPGKTTLPANWRHPNPTLYTPEIADEIIERVSAGETLAFVVRNHEDGSPREPKSWPAYATIRDWADPNDNRYIEEFGIRFARARLHQMHMWIEETIDIANRPEIGIEEVHAEEKRLGIAKKGGGEREITFTSTRRMKKDMLAHRQLMIETRFKAAARLNPALWAERLQVAQHDVNAEENQIVVRGGLPEGPPASSQTIDGEFTEKPPE